MLAFQADEITETSSDVVDGATDAVGDTADAGLDVVGDIKDGVSDVISDVMAFLPNLVGFLLALIIGMFVAKFLARMVKKLFRKINFDSYVDKSGLGAPLERAGFSDSGKFFAKVIYFLIMLFVLKIAFALLDVNALNEPFDQLITWIPKALVAMILIVVGGIVANAVKDIVGGATAGQGYSNLVTKAAFIGVWIIFGLAALNQIQIAEELVNTMTEILFTSIGAIVVIKFGIGGIWAARDRFWPAVYDSVTDVTGKQPKPPTQSRPQA